MKRPSPTPEWPPSWTTSYQFDLVEAFGARPRSGHAYQYDVRREQTLQLVEKCLPRGGRVLDLAAAQGNFTLWLAERGYDVTWNDLREDLAGYVRLKHESGTVRYAPGNAMDLAFERPFDLVLMTEIIEHVAHPDQLLAGVARLVKPGGWIVLTTPNGAYLRNALPRFSDFEDTKPFEAVQFRPDSDGHIFLLHEDEVRSLASRAGLNVEELVYFTNILTIGHMKTEPLLRLLPPALVRCCERLSRGLPTAARRRLHYGLAALLRRA